MQPEQKQLINVVKLFLSHFGYLSMEDSHKIEYLQNSNQLHRQLAELDMIPERYQINVACYLLLDVYSKDPKEAFMDTSKKTPESHEPYILAYRNFISQLGILLKEETLQMGMFNSLKSLFQKDPSAKVHYSSNVFFETLFLPACDLSLFGQA